MQSNVSTECGISKLRSVVLPSQHVTLREIQPTGIEAAIKNNYDIIMWYGKCQYMHLHQYAIGITVNETIAGEVIHYIRVFDCSVRIQVDKILVSFIQLPIASYSLPISILGLL